VAEPAVARHAAAAKHSAAARHAAEEHGPALKRAGKMPTTGRSIQATVGKAAIKEARGLTTKRQAAVARDVNNRMQNKFWEKNLAGA